VALDLPAESRQFSYPSVSAGVAANAAALARFLSDIPTHTAHRIDTLHLVGHSLGGLVILKMFADASACPTLPPGRIVLMGSPVQGSRAAQSLALRKAAAC